LHVSIAQIDTTRFQIKKKKEKTLNLLSYKDYEGTNIIEKFSKKIYVNFIYLKIIISDNLFLNF